jgi:hypothetical protein
MVSQPLVCILISQSIGVQTPSQADIRLLTSRREWHGATSQAHDSTNVLSCQVKMDGDRPFLSAERPRTQGWRLVFRALGRCRTQAGVPAHEHVSWFPSYTGE